jgi:hypothetical protein
MRLIDGPHMETDISALKLIQLLLTLDPSLFTHLTTILSLKIINYITWSNY